MLHLCITPVCSTCQDMFFEPFDSQAQHLCYFIQFFLASSINSAKHYCLCFVSVLRIHSNVLDDILNNIAEVNRSFLTDRNGLWALFLTNKKILAIIILKFLRSSLTFFSVETSPRLIKNVRNVLVSPL